MEILLDKLPIIYDIKVELGKHLTCGLCHKVKFTKTLFSRQSNILPLIKFETYHLEYPRTYTPIECCVDCFDNYIDERINNIVNHIAPLHCKHLSDAIDFIDFCLHNVPKHKIHKSLTRISQKHADIYRIIYKL